MSDEPWHPTEVGQLFFVVMPNGNRILARVTEIESPTKWSAVNAGLDDAMALTGDEPQVDWSRK